MLMQAQYAAENVTSLAPEHFLARKATDLASIKNLARENPAALVRNILESLDGKATAQQINEWLVGDVFTEAEWKRWWESTKKTLKASGVFSVPAKKTDPIQIRSEGVSHAEELLDGFNKARQPKEQMAALDQIIRSHQQFKAADKQLQPIIASIENMLATNPDLTNGTNAQRRQEASLVCGSAGDDNSGRPQQSFLQSITATGLAQNHSLGDLIARLMGDCFVQVRVECFPLGLDWLQPIFCEQIIELFLNENHS